MSGGGGLESGGKVGGDSSAACVSLAGLSPRLRAWLPGVFAARLLRGVRLPGGRIVGEIDRVVHLFAIPAGQLMPEQLCAFCGLVIGRVRLSWSRSGRECPVWRVWWPRRILSPLSAAAEDDDVVPVWRR
jgi:hypothetical protein